MDTVRSRLDHLVGCTWFWVWALVGFGFALSAVSLGFILMLPLVIVAIVFGTSERPRRSAFGLLTGFGFLCLLVAELQRGGQNLDARPWLVAGLLLALAGITAHALTND